MGYDQKSRSMRNSYTRREIERFWRNKQLVEDDHFLHAIKASARLRAIHFSEEEYRTFVESLEEIENIQEDVNKDYHGVGIKDWWTKSKYAYLNEPAIGTLQRPSKRSNYKPNNIILCNYKLISSPQATPSYEVHSLGVH